VNQVARIVPKLAGILVACTGLSFNIDALQADPFDSISEQAEPSFKPSTEIVEAGKRLDPKLLELLSRQGAVVRGSKELNTTKMAEQAPVDITSSIDSRLATKEIVYIRNSGGEEIQKEIPFPTPNPQRLEQLAKENALIVERAFEEQLTVRKIPDCREPSTVRTPIKAKLEAGEESKVVFDLLFMRKSEVPLDSKEVLGIDPLVVPYDPESSLSTALSAQGLGVKCLPTRIRITSLANYTHTGKDALKNFDGEPDGEGTLNQRFGGKAPKNSANKRGRDEK
jgi:hypothetical protein